MDFGEPEGELDYGVFLGSTGNWRRVKHPGLNLNHQLMSCLISLLVFLVWRSHQMSGMSWRYCVLINSCFLHPTVKMHFCINGKIIGHTWWFKLGLSQNLLCTITVAKVIPDNNVITISTSSASRVSCSYFSCLPAIMSDSSRWLASYFVLSCLLLSSILWPVATSVKVLCYHLLWQSKNRKKWKLFKGP